MADTAFLDFDDAAFEAFVGSHTFGADHLKDDSAGRIDWFYGRTSDGQDWIVGKGDDGFDFYRVSSGAAGEPAFDLTDPLDAMTAFGAESGQDVKALLAQADISPAGVYDACTPLIGVLDTMDEGETTGV